MEKIVSKKKGRLEGDIVVPGDKSISHRAIIIGSLANGKTTIQGLHHLDRGYEQLEAKLQKLGAQLQRVKGSVDSGSNSQLPT